MLYRLEKGIFTPHDGMHGMKSGEMIHRVHDFSTVEARVNRTNPMVDHLLKGTYRDEFKTTSLWACNLIYS